MSRKKAFTVIELIFVIVVVGILTSIALTKLAATRDDARVSMIAYNTMTAATEIAAYAVSQGETEAVLGEMSRSIEILVNKGYASDTGSYRVDISSDDDTEVCLIMKIDGSGEDTEVLTVENGPASDESCLHLQDLIDFGSYPMPLRGSYIILP
jgi:prepilin-type N-terminal cleavage/methylation domain-containing protein